MSNKPKWNTPTYWCASCLAPISQQILSTNSNPDYCPDCNRKLSRMKTGGV